jgi:hypothetical protein
MDQGFIRYFAVVTVVLAAAVYLAAQAVKHGGVVLSLLAVVAGAIGLLGFAGLARVVVITERERRHQ